MTAKLRLERPYCQATTISESESGVSCKHDIEYIRYILMRATHSFGAVRLAEGGVQKLRKPIEQIRSD